MRKCVHAIWIIIIGLCLILPATAQTANGNFDPALQALSAGNVYVDPRLAGQVDQERLEQAALGGQDTPHTAVKIAVLKFLPNGYHDPAKYADQLNSLVGNSRTALALVVIPGDGRLDVRVRGGNLSAQEESRLAKQFGSQIVSDPTVGTAALAQGLAGDINNKEYKQTGGLWMVFLLIVVGVAVLLIIAARKRKVEMSEMRAPIDTLRTNVLQGVEYLDNYMDVLPKNNPDSDAARMARQSAVSKYDNAVKILDHASAQSDLQRAQGLLDRAQADVQTARAALDRALGNTASIPGDDALRPPPLPQSESEVQVIPEKQRGASFFSSQPAPLYSLVPVTITVDGHSKQVLATPEEADELRQGRMPQVRAFNVGGRQVPWYEYNQYDPYNDYWRYQNNGWGGFGSGAVAGFIGAELLGGLLSPGYGYGGGYSPYAFDTGNSYYQGYADAQANDGFGGFDAGGGSGFFGSGSDSGNTDNSGNADSGGGFDFGGNSDFGDPGSSDSGGGTFDGGGDSGGGFDFGGGGDFGGGDSGGGDF